MNPLNSSSEPRVRLHVRTRVGAAPLAITLVDASFAEQGNGFRELHCTLPVGLYELRLRAGPVSATETLALHGDQAELEVERALELPTAAPLHFSRFHDAEHAQALTTVTDRLDPQGNAALAVMLRDLGSEEWRPIGAGDLALIDAEGARVEMSYTTVDRERCALWTAVVAPGGYVLEGRDRESLVHQSLWLAPTLQTIVCVPREAARPTLERASVHVAPAGRPWPRSPDELAHVVELALWGLRSGRAEIPVDYVSERLLDRMAEAPMAGLLAAHGLLRERPFPAKLFDALLGRLEDLLGDHPDLLALRWLGAEVQETSVALSLRWRRARAPWPPLLRAGYQATVRLDARFPGVIGPTTLPADIGGRLLAGGPWTRWEPEARMAPPEIEGPARLRTDTWTDWATERVDRYLDEVACVAEPERRSRRRTREARVAVATGVPVARVKRALDEIEHSDKLAAARDDRERLEAERRDDLGTRTPAAGVYLSTRELRTVEAFADMFTGIGTALGPREVAYNVDGWLARQDAWRIRGLRLLLWLVEYLLPLVSLTPLPFSRLPTAKRHRLIERALKRSASGAVRRALTEVRARVIEGYYGDLRAQTAIGAKPRVPRRARPPELGRPDRWRTYDLCVVGARAAGSLIAAEAARAGLEVVVLERRPDLGATCADAVGARADAGTVLAAWEAFGAAVDPKALSRAYDRVEQRVRGKPLELGGSSAILLHGERELRRHGRAGEWRVGRLERLIALDVYARDAATAGAVIAAGCDARKVDNVNGQASVVHYVRLGVEETLKARTVVLTGGPVASSILLLNSGITNRVGSRLAYNASTPVLARMPSGVGLDEPPGAYIDTGSHRIESRSASPVDAAIAISGWFDRHLERMRDYPRLVEAAVQVATNTTGHIRRWSTARDLAGPVRWNMQPDELAVMREGIATAAALFFAAGADLVYPATVVDGALDRGRFVHGERVDMAAVRDHVAGLVQHPADLLMTSDAQGGNPMSDRPDAGVVDSTFRVHGTTNVYVCDASVFPTAIGVDPRLTVLALADYAWHERIAERLKRAGG